MKQKCWCRRIQNQQPHYNNFATRTYCCHKRWAVIVYHVLLNKCKKACQCQCFKEEVFYPANNRTQVKSQKLSYVRTCRPYVAIHKVILSFWSIRLLLNWRKLTDSFSGFIHFFNSKNCDRPTDALLASNLSL